MKVVHCLGWYLPDSVGGTEIYVQGLCRELQARGVEVVVMAPRDGDAEARYVHEGIEVLRYPLPVARDRDQLQGNIPHGRFDVFERQLRELRADVFHIHSLTTGCNWHHAALARSLGLRTLMTAHVPGVVCARGTMMRFGREACDGRIDPEQCVPCWLGDGRLPETLARPFGALLQKVPAQAAKLASGRLRTLLQAPELIAVSGVRLREFVVQCDRVVAVCAWLRDALLVNGVPASALRECRQGVSAVLPEGQRGPLERAGAGERLRVGFFGRCVWIKGLDVLLHALRALPPHCPIELAVRAVPVSDKTGYARYIAALAAADPRVHVLPPVPNDQIQSAMRQCDVVAVPSRCLETGPLVAMDALGAGIPVLGSDLGGLRELIEPGRTGWLVRADDVGAWSAQLAALARPGAARLSWPAASTPVLTHADVAVSMLALYREVLESR